MVCLIPRAAGRLAACFFALIYICLPESCSLKLNTTFNFSTKALFIFGRKAFLIQSAVAIIFLGLSYGVNPQALLGALLQFLTLNVDLKHIFKGVMGLCIGMALYWLWASNKPEAQQGAIISCVVFMAGLASGRVVSFLADGWPSPLLLGYAVAEILVVLMGLSVLRCGN